MARPGDACSVEMPPDRAQSRGQRVRATEWGPKRVEERLDFVYHVKVTCRHGRCFREEGEIPTNIDVKKHEKQTALLTSPGGAQAG